MLLDLAELLRERELIILAQVLVPEDEDVMLTERSKDGREEIRWKPPREIRPGDRSAAGCRHSRPDRGAIYCAASERQLVHCCWLLIAAGPASMTRSAIGGKPGAR
jgi:hypothetical protein